MTDTRNFVVKPQGNVRGGKASYTVDSETGRIFYAAEVTAGLGWPLNKTEKTSGNYQADPALLKPQRWNTPGATTRIGDVSFLVTAVGQGQVTVSVAVEGSSIAGIGTVDTSGDIVRVKELIAKVAVPVLGVLTVQADEMPARYDGGPPWYWALLSPFRDLYDLFLMRD